MSTVIIPLPSPVVSSINPRPVRDGATSFRRHDAHKSVAGRRLTHHAPTEWTPLLSGKLGKQAAAVIEAISNEVLRGAVRRSSASAPGRRRSCAIMDSSLAGGSAGLAVFYANLAQTGHANAARRALGFLSHAVDLLAA